MSDYVVHQPRIVDGVSSGDRVRCVRGDWFIDEGAAGLVTNVMRGYRKPDRAFVMWDNDCRSMINIDDIEVIGGDS